MLKPIPIQMLRHKATVIIPTEIDANQAVTGTEEITLKRCMIQRSDRTKISKDNTEVTLPATLYVDARLTYPRIDWEMKKQFADAVNASIKVLFGGKRYTLYSVEEYLDDNARVHHYELGLI